MSTLGDLLVAAALIAFVIGTGVVAIAWLLRGAYRLRRHHRRHPRLEPLTDREVIDALAPFGADISIWPSRAPRNGSAYDEDPTAP